MMLVLSICEKILESFGQISEAFRTPTSSPLISGRSSITNKSRDHYNSHIMMRHTINANVFDSSAPSDVAVSGSSVKIFADAILDTEDELNILNVVVTARMKNLGNLLSRLERMISSNQWFGHAIVLEALRSTYRTTASVISTMELQQ